MEKAHLGKERRAPDEVPQPGSRVHKVLQQLRAAREHAHGVGEQEALHDVRVEMAQVRGDEAAEGVRGDVRGGDAVAAQHRDERLHDVVDGLGLRAEPQAHVAHLHRKRRVWQR